MNVVIDRIKLLFLGLFILATGAIWAYQACYVWPRQACEAHGDWWDDSDRQCAVPMPIWKITGRMPGSKSSSASAPAPAGAPKPSKP